MAFDEGLAARLRKVLEGRSDVTERKMFGGIAFLVRGNMCVGIVDHDLMVRVGPENHDYALGQPHTRPMDFTGKPSKGMVYVAPAGFVRAPGLRKWVNLALSFVDTLPARPSKSSGRRESKSNQRKRSR